MIQKFPRIKCEPWTCLICGKSVGKGEYHLKNACIETLSLELEAARAFLKKELAAVKGGASKEHELRTFLKVSYEATNDLVKEPRRKTESAAGFDFYSPVSVRIPIGGVVHIPTGIKCYMPDNEYLQLSIRSGMATKGIIMAQGVGIIDADYADCEENDGNIGFTLINLSGEPYKVKVGDRIGQGIFLEYKITDDDAKYSKEVRKGGFNSTGN